MGWGCEGVSGDLASECGGEYFACGVVFAGVVADEDDVCDHLAGCVSDELVAEGWVGCSASCQCYGLGTESVRGWHAHCCAGVCYEGFAVDAGDESWGCFSEDRAVCGEPSGSCHVEGGETGVSGDP